MKILSAFATLLLVPLLLPLVAANAVAGERPTSHFVLKYQDSDYVVPKGEQWELTWKSPYKPGDVVPAYDVRVRGDVMVWMNRNRSIQVAASNATGDGSLDISASSEETSIWLPAGTKFEIANDLLRIQVAVYRVPLE